MYTYIERMRERERERDVPCLFQAGPGERARRGALPIEFDGLCCLYETDRPTAGATRRCTMPRVGGSGSKKRAGESKRTGNTYNYHWIQRNIWISVPFYDMPYAIV